MSAVLSTLERPAGWAIALAGFLARGGVIVFLLPIVTIPTPAGIQARLSPLLVPFAFGEVAPGFVLLVAGLASVALAWIVVGGLVGAWSEVQLVRDAAAQQEPPVSTSAGGPRVVLEVLAARLLAHVPLGAALAWGAARIVDVTYAELTTPFEVVTPLAVRIVAAAPDAVAAVVGTWLLGEAAGGLAAREIIVDRRDPLAAVVTGWFRIVRRPVSALATIGSTSLALVVTIAPGLVAAGAAWSWVRTVLFDAGNPAELAVPLAVFVALWLGALALTGFGAALRSNAWTIEWLRRRQTGPLADGDRTTGTRPVGTIGDGEPTQQGGWPSPGASDTV